MDNILIVAPTIPVFNRIAGEYRIFNIAKILTHKYNVFLFPIISDKCEKSYLNYLNKNKINVIYAKDLKEVIKQNNYTR